MRVMLSRNEVEKILLDCREEFVSGKVLSYDWILTGLERGSGGESPLFEFDINTTEED